MAQGMRTKMQAAAIDRFGSADMIRPHTLPVPEVGPDEILIKVESAGVGVWDRSEREGRFARMLGGEPRFPYVLGSDGAGIVTEAGAEVTRFRPGDRVYAYAFMNPKGGFYAEYAVVKADNASLIPGQLSLKQAGVLPVDALTALRGLDDVLGMKPGESVLILGASGGVGHLAVQLAKRMGARVLALASGDDGVRLAWRLGADMALEGHRDNVAAAARQFAPHGLDAVLLTTGGLVARQVLETVRDGGRVAYPNGVQPVPEARAGIRVQSYDGFPTRELMDKLNSLIDKEPFEVHVARTFPLDQAAEAHRALKVHYLGKLAITPR